MWHTHIQRRWTAAPETDELVVTTDSEDEKRQRTNTSRENQRESITPTVRWSYEVDVSRSMFSDTFTTFMFKSLQWADTHTHTHAIRTLRGSKTRVIILRRRKSSSPHFPSCLLRVIVSCPLLSLNIFLLISTVPLCSHPHICFLPLFFRPFPLFLLTPLYSF